MLGSATSPLPRHKPSWGSSCWVVASLRVLCPAEGLRGPWEVLTLSVGDLGQVPLLPHASGLLSGGGWWLMCLILPLLTGVGLAGGSAAAELVRAVAILRCPRAGRVEARPVLESPGVDFSQAAK